MTIKFIHIQILVSYCFIVSCCTSSLAIETDRGLSSEELPSYYNPYLNKIVSATLEDIKSNKEGGEDYFFFITDTHFQEENNNVGISGRLIRYLYKKTGICKVVHGGDAGLASSSKELMGRDGIFQSIDWSNEKLFKYLDGLQALNLHGNHDYNNFYNDNSDSVYFSGLEIPEVRNIIMSSISLPVVSNVDDELGMYYYYDSIISKIRYIIIDCEYNQVNGSFYLGAKQLKWILNNAILTTPLDYDIIFITHCPIEDFVDSTNEREPFSDLLLIIKAINNKRKGVIECLMLEYDFSSFAPNVLMVLSGHNHMDIATFVDNVFHVSTKCDKMDNSYPCPSPFDNWEERKSGTINEQAFDIISVLHNHRVIQFRRIGSGANRLFHTQKIPLSIGNKISFIDSVSFIPKLWKTCNSTGNIFRRDPLEWTINNTILSVENGMVTALKEGDAMLIAQDFHGNKEFFYLSVVE